MAEIPEPEKPAVAVAAATVPVAAGPSLEDQVRAMRVRVRKVGEAYRVEFPQGTRIPKMALVKLYLPEKYRAKVKASEWEYGDMQEVVNATIARGVCIPQAWADAIGQAMVQQAVAENPEGFMAAMGPDPLSAVELAAGAPAYMVIGGMVYRMTPTAAVDKTGALGAIRKIARERSEAEAKTLIEAGKKEHAMLIRQAEKIKSDVEDERRRLATEKGLVLPNYGYRLSWRRMFANRDGIRYASFPFEVELDATFAPTSIIFEYDGKRYSWAPLQAPPFAYKFWLPVNPMNGSYSVNSAHLGDRARYGLLPHMHETTLCGTIEGLPKEIHTDNDLNRVRAAVERAMNGVNLASPLARTNDYKPEVKAFLPKEVLQYLASGDNHVALIASSTESVKQSEFLAETWNR